MDRIPVVARYPVREALLAYLSYLKAEAKESWYLDLELYSHGFGKKPKMPEILRHG